MLKEMPEIIYTGLKRVLGSPSEYIEHKTQTQKVEVKIPLNETEQGVAK